MSSLDMLQFNVRLKLNRRWYFWQGVRDVILLLVVVYCSMYAFTYTHVCIYLYTCMLRILYRYLVVESIDVHQCLRLCYTLYYILRFCHKWQDWDLGSFPMTHDRLNNSLIIFPHISHVYSHAGDTLVSSDWFANQSLARDYRYRHALFYDSTCWLVGDISPTYSTFEWKHFPVSMVCVDPVCPTRHQWHACHQNFV